MFEIELKAHVSDRAPVIAALNSFACYQGAVQKEDCYYALQGKKRCRIRKETPFLVQGQPEPQLPAGKTAVPRCFFTYKRKERRTSADGIMLEVNDEKESEFCSSEALEAYLSDNGFEVVLKKHKTVLGWMYKDIHIELCSVPPLGDFLELETLAEKNDTQTIEHRQKALKDVLKRAGLNTDAIENRYYSDMLREAEKISITGGQKQCLTEDYINSRHEKL
ncbi:MAG: class IV adenylate cyclase [Treponema sp.]|nr:class IV adenylate cyclase [Treponema sp.]